MYTLSVLVAVLATVCVACALPLNKPRPPNKPKNTADLFANQTASSCKVIHNINTTKNGLVDPSYRWEAFNVYIDEAYEQAEREAIEIAMWTIMQILPCISFGIWDPGTTPTGDYVRTVNELGSGCVAPYPGRIGGVQEMYLESPGCLSQGIILKGLIVALGLTLEHLRRDRDAYVEIKFENILPGYEEQFDKVEPPDWNTYGVPYNTRSIMHGDAFFLSSNEEPTIVAKDGGEVGDVGVLQDTDIQKLNIMYNCL